MSFRITVERHFCAAHFLKDYDGKCQQEHGHTWKVRATFISGQNLSELGKSNMLCDFKVLKGLIDAHLPDHEQLNTFYQEDNPTAEWLAMKLYVNISRDLETQQRLRNLHLCEITVFESETCFVTFSG